MDVQLVGQQLSYCEEQVSEMLLLWLQYQLFHEANPLRVDWAACACRRSHKIAEESLEGVEGRVKSEKD